MLKGHLVRRTVGWVLILALVYVVFILSLGAMQRHFLYYPDPAKFEPSEWALKEMQPFPVMTADGLNLTSWYCHPAKPGKLTLVFFQGNAGHLGYRNYKIRSWLNGGYGVLLVGYRGFGNPGSPSEEGLYDDARAAVDALRAKGVPENDMVFYGESMGTGVAVQMATEYHAAALILESPFTSVPDVGADRYPLVPVHWLLRDKYDSLSKIKNVHMPLLLMHGDLDQIVPVKFGHELLDAANEPKQGEFIPDAGHNDVYNMFAEQVVLNFIAGLPAEGKGSGVGVQGSGSAKEKQMPNSRTPNPEP